MTANSDPKGWNLDRRLIEERYLSAHRSILRNPKSVEVHRAEEAPLQPRIPTSVLVLSAAAMLACALWTVLQ